jgi:hypothetical protein
MNSEDAFLRCVHVHLGVDEADEDGEWLKSCMTGR